MTSDHGVINTNISNATSSLSSLINTKGTVKSVQRGYFKFINVSGGTIGTFEISISDINPDKSVIMIFPHLYTSCYDSVTEITLSKTKILISYDTTGKADRVIGYFNWQVIEFY